MQRFYDYKGVPAQARRAVAAIGNFDGVHLGHQALFARARALAREQGVPFAVVTFEPHPRLFFAPQGAPFRLMTAAQKENALASAGVEVLFSLPFDAALAALTPEAFAEDVLAKGLGLSSVVVGEGFAFGRARSGGIDDLKALGGRFGFDVSVLSPVDAPDGAPYASSRVRGLLANGDLDSAAGLLGRPWEIEGPVIHGDKRGRELGFPTANQDLGDYLRPLFGIYAVRARVEEGRWLDGVSSLGIRPMFKTVAPLLETHIFDFDEDIYGKKLAVQPVKFLRPEARYDTIEALKRQISEDCQNARAVLKSRA